MKTILLFASVFALMAMALDRTALADEPQAVEPKQTWKGSIDDLGLLKDAPKVVTTQKAFADLWKTWKLAGDVPQVDFKKSLVVLVTGRGSVLNARVSQKGDDLAVHGFGTKDLRPGFRYVLAEVSREGVKKVNGKELAAD